MNTSVLSLCTVLFVIVKFCICVSGLKAVRVCFIMSHREEMHLNILKAFVGLHEFSDLNLVQALRFVTVSSKCGSSLTFSLAFLTMWKSTQSVQLWICHFLQRLADSFCGAFVSREKLRRLTGWWRHLQRATVTVTQGSSNPQVHAQGVWFILSSVQLMRFILNTTFSTRNTSCLWKKSLRNTRETTAISQNKHVVFCVLAHAETYYLQWMQFIQLRQR